MDPSQIVFNVCLHMFFFHLIPPLAAQCLSRKWTQTSKQTITHPPLYSVPPSNWLCCAHLKSIAWHVDVQNTRVETYFTVNGFISLEIFDWQCGWGRTVNTGQHKIPSSFRESLCICMDWSLLSLGQSRFKHNFTMIPKMKLVVNIDLCLS